MISKECATAPSTERSASWWLVGLWVWLLGAVLGSALQLQQGRLWPWPVYAALLGAGVLPGLLRWARPWPWALLLGLALGGGNAGLRASVYGAGALAPELEGRDLHLSGVVSQMPQRSEVGLRFRLEVESMQWAQASAGAVPDEPTPAATPAAASGAALPRVPDRIILSWYATDRGYGGSGAGSAASATRPTALPALHAGERWQFTVRLKAPHGNLNPHGFDYELWLWEQGVRATGYVRSATRAQAQPHWGAGGWHGLERGREAVRDAILERIAPATEPALEPARRRWAGVVAALAVGDQSAIDRADWDVFRATGIAHLMSISGLHVTLFAWLAAAGVGGLWRRSPRLMQRLPAPTAALLGGVALATLYALFSGWGVPSQRTVWMLGALALLRLSGRQWPWPQVWLAVGAVLALLDPWALAQPSFWLSFVAVGVLFATNLGATNVYGVGAKQRFVSKIAALMREQWAVTLALTPLTLLLFQQTSVVGLLANAVAIPWVTLVILPLSLLGVWLAPLWDLAAWAVQILSTLLAFLAALPGAALSTPAPPLWAALAGVAGGLLLALRWPPALRVLGLPLLAPVLLWQAPRPPAGEFELLAADVGQGNAVLVRTAQHALLYDAGPRYGLESDAGHRVLVPLLRALDERLDVLLLSHRDTDHVGGAVAVLAMQPQARLLSSIEAEHPLQALRPAQRCLAGQRWHWDGVDFELLHPSPGDYERGLKANALSCVLRISNGRSSALLTGDIEREQEAALVRALPQQLKSDWLLVPHHGSKTSSSPALLSAVQPRVALAQAGYRNRFGHPASLVLARYRAAAIPVWDSAGCGAARWASSAPARMDCQRDSARRYWHHAWRAEAH